MTQQLVLTAIIAFFLVLLSLIGLSIGYIIRKKKLTHGCGTNPEFKDNCICGKESCENE